MSPRAAFQNLLERHEVPTLRRGRRRLRTFTEIIDRYPQGLTHWRWGHDSLDEQGDKRPVTGDCNAAICGAGRETPSARPWSLFRVVTRIVTKNGSRSPPTLHPSWRRGYGVPLGRTLGDEEEPCFR